MKFTNMITGETVEPEPWQLELKAGDFYTIQNAMGAVGQDVFEVPTVYGRLEEVAEPGFFLARGFSQWCPEGELGVVNICEPTRQLTEAEFELAKDQGWP